MFRTKFLILFSVLLVLTSSLLLPRDHHLKAKVSKRNEDEGQGSDEVSHLFSHEGGHGDSDEGGHGDSDEGGHGDSDEAENHAIAEVETAVIHPDISSEDISSDDFFCWDLLFNCSDEFYNIYGGNTTQRAAAMQKKGFVEYCEDINTFFDCALAAMQYEECHNEEYVEHLEEVRGILDWSCEDNKELYTENFHCIADADHLEAEEECWMDLFFDDYSDDSSDSSESTECKCAEEYLLCFEKTLDVDCQLEFVNAFLVEMRSFIELFDEHYNVLGCEDESDTSTNESEHESEDESEDESEHEPEHESEHESEQESEHESPVIAHHNGPDKKSLVKKFIRSVF